MNVFMYESVRNAFDNDAEQYMNFSKLLCDAGKGSLESGITKADADKLISEKFDMILGLDKNASLKERKRAIRNHKNELFDILIDYVDDMITAGWENNSFFNEFVEVRNISRGDLNEFVTEDQSVLSVAKISGNHWDIDRQRLGTGKPYQIPTEWVGLGVYAEYERVLQNVSDWTRLTRAVYAAFDAYINEIVYKAVMEAGTKVLPGSDQFYKSAELNAESKLDFMTMVEDVAAANGGSPVVIMGTKTALSRLSNIVPVDWRSETDKEDHRNMGHVGIWEGTPVVEIPQILAKNDPSTRLIDNNVLLIIPVQDNRFVKVVYEGDAEVREITDNATLNDMTYELKYLTKLGVGTVIGRIFGTWKIITG